MKYARKRRLLINFRIWRVPSKMAAAKKANHGTTHRHGNVVCGAIIANDKLGCRDDLNQLRQRSLPTKLIEPTSDRASRFPARSCSDKAPRSRMSLCGRCIFRYFSNTASLSIGHIRPACPAPTATAMVVRERGVPVRSNLYRDAGSPVRHITKLEFRLIS